MLKIKAEKRNIFGKELKSERLAGRMPIVVYGRKQAPQAFFVDTREFKKVLAQAGESTMVSVAVADQAHDAMIHEVDFHPLTGEPRHADFLLIDKTKAIQVKVPLTFDGVSPAVKDLGGILVKVLHELEIEALPANIPHDIPVDIAPLATLESQILVKDLNISKDIKVINQPEAVVASISVAKEEPVEEAPVDLTAIEVEKKGKKEEEGEAPAAPEVPAATKGDEAKK
ncbi:MAG: 50S ribosomal protein L25 [Candidatus Vogelbacteria bacterium]|nr:50S ribosomal protein L25 [Candidatus Vogelbacteria bacterium]